MTVIIRIVFVLVLLAGAAHPQEVAPPGSVELTGAAISAGTISAADLAAMPQVEAQVRFATSKGEEKGLYKGVLIWTLLQGRGIADLPGHNAALAHTFVVKGRDDYQVAFSIGEIAPDFGKAPIMLATELDGQALVPGPGFRLIAPGDARGARNVKDVVRIEVK